MNFEVLTKSKLPVLLAIPAGALALAGCGPNYSGSGNEFVVHGRVTGPGKHSLKANIFEIDEVSGQAEGWFKIDTVHQLHDNCDCHGSWANNKKYGTVFSMRGYEISPSDVAIGACVRFEGKIRADQDGKNTHDRPVYDVAQVESCKL